jgi:hypothetical protein
MAEPLRLLGSIMSLYATPDKVRQTKSVIIFYADLNEERPYVPVWDCR